MRDLHCLISFIFNYLKKIRLYSYSCSPYNQACRQEFPTASRAPYEAWCFCGRGSWRPGVFGAKFWNLAISRLIFKDFHTILDSRTPLATGMKLYGICINHKLMPEHVCTYTAYTLARNKTLKYFEISKYKWKIICIIRRLYMNNCLCIRYKYSN